MELIEEMESAFKNYFTSLDNVVFAYLFGSYGRGQAGPLSDIDVAVWLTNTLSDDDCFEKRLQITGDLSAMLQVNGVDVVILNQAPLALSYRVLRDGRLLYCSDRNQMIGFIARIISAYLDFKPVIDRHERVILARARRGELFDGYNPHRGALERYRQLRQRLKGNAGLNL